MFWSRVWVFYDCFSTGKHRAHACSNTIFSMICMIICINRTWAELCSILPKAKYDGKWKYFYLFAKLQELAYFGDVMDTQIMNSED